MISQFRKVLRSLFTDVVTFMYVYMSTLAWPKYVTGFVKKGPGLHNLPTLTTHNFRLEKVTDLKFGQ